jgi:hypothetical protein
LGGRLGLQAIGIAATQTKPDDSGLKQLLSDFNRPVISESVPNQESLIFDGVNSLISDIFSYTVDRIMANGKSSLAALPFDKFTRLIWWVSK